jgi:hypothetical protein
MSIVSILVEEHLLEVPDASSTLILKVARAHPIRSTTDLEILEPRIWRTYDQMRLFDISFAFPHAIAILLCTHVLNPYDTITSAGL